jgi:hypothetical protein
MTRSQEAAAGRLNRLEIRPFRPTDLDDVIGLWQSCNLVRPWNSPSKDIVSASRLPTPFVHPAIKPAPKSDRLLGC